MLLCVDHLMMLSLMLDYIYHKMTGKQWIMGWNWYGRKQSGWGRGGGAYFKVLSRQNCPAWGSDWAPPGYKSETLLLEGTHSVSGLVIVIFTAVAPTFNQLNPRLILHTPFPLLMLFCRIYWGNMVALDSKYICNCLQWLCIHILRIHHLEPMTTAYSVSN